MSASPVFDDRPLIGTPPTDGAGVEIAPGVFIPENRCDAVMELIASDEALYDMIQEIIVEKESWGEGLSDDDCVVVPFWFLAQVQRSMAHKMLDLSYQNTLQARRVHSVAAPFLNYGAR